MASVLLPRLGEDFDTSSMANLVSSFSGANSKFLEHFLIQILSDFLSENEMAEGANTGDVEEGSSLAVFIDAVGMPW